MRWLPALLLVLVFVVPLFIGGLSSVAVATFVLDRSWYAGLLSDERLYDIPDAVAGATWNTGIPALAGFPRTLGREALRELLPSAYLRDQASAVVDQLFTFLWGRGPLDLSVDLAPLKTRLTGDTAKRFALAMAKDLPEAATAAAPGRGVLPAARPKGWTVEQTARAIEGALPAVLAKVPDRVTIGDTVPLPWRGFTPFGMLLGAAVVLLVLAAGAWVGSAFTFSSVPRERLLWLGGSLLAPALCVLAVGVGAAISPLTVPWVRFGINSVDFTTVGLGQGFADAVIDVAAFAARRVATGFLATGGVAAGLGIGLLVWGGIRTAEEQPKQA